MLKKLNEAELGALKIGSVVTRVMQGVEDEVMINRMTPELITVVTTKPMELVNRIARIAGEMLGIKDVPQNVLPQWDFDPKTGYEIDEEVSELQDKIWGKRHIISYLAKERE